MRLVKNLSLLQVSMFVLLFCISGVLGYLYYDTYKTNIQNRELIAESKIEAKDLSQDLEIMKYKYELVLKEVAGLKSNVAKISYRKKKYKPKKIYSAGRSSKKKHYSSRKKISYKTLYYRLKSQCSMHKRKKS